MPIFVIGGAGFIGIRVIHRLAGRGEKIVCMDINPSAPALGDKVSMLRGAVIQFDDVIANMEAAKNARSPGTTTSTP